MTTLKKISAIACLFIVAFLICHTAFAQETKTFIAYSMKVAQARVEEAILKGGDFRKKQPDLFYLGGITKPWAVVLDTENNDWILVGERDPKSSILTLDDWVVALRARFIHPDKDPGVTIDPRPCETCVKSGKKEGCRHSTKQDVRFFGGIEDTHFGKVCYEADWLMKKIALSLEKLPVKNLKSSFDLCLEQVRNSGMKNSIVCSRYWFYPIMNRVNVISDVVLLEQFKMGVFTEVLYAEIDGKPVADADIDKFEHYPLEGFARSFSENYDAAAQSREILETLRGLTRLAALAKGLTQADGKPKIDFYMSNYPIGKSKTLLEVEVLKNENREVGFRVEGGVELMALAMCLKGGDAGALKELVLKGRKTVGSNALTWGFEMQIQDGRLAGVVIPEGSVDYDQIVPLFQQASFLEEKKRYDDAIILYGEIIKLKPDWYAAYFDRGNVYSNKGEYDYALADYNKSIEINPIFVEAWNNRGNIYSKKGDYERAIADFNKALKINPNLVDAYYNRGLVYREKGEHERAISDFDKALEINPMCAEAYNGRGIIYSEKGEYKHAIANYNKAIDLNPMCTEAYLNREFAYRGGFDSGTSDCLIKLGLYVNLMESEACDNNKIAHGIENELDYAISYFNKEIEINHKDAEAYNGRGIICFVSGKYNLAIADYNKALEINPMCVGAYNNRGIVYYKLGEYNNAIADYNRAIEIDPKFAKAYNNRGVVYDKKGKYNRAIKDYNEALKINPIYAKAYYNRGRAFMKKGKYEYGISDHNKAIEIIPFFTETNRNRAHFRNIASDKYEYYSIADYEITIELNPRFADIYCNYGYAYLFINALDDAIEEFNRLLQINPESYIYYTRGYLYLLLGKFNYAVSDFTKAIGINPNFLYAYLNRGVAYLEKGDYDNAIADFSKIQEIDPMNVKVCLNRGYAYRKKGKYDLAVADYNKALEINPMFADAYNGRGSVFSVKGEGDRAIVDYNKALEINPMNAGVLYNLAVTYYDLGEYNKAFEYFNKAKIFGISVDQEVLEKCKKALEGKK